MLGFLEGFAPTIAKHFRDIEIEIADVGTRLQHDRPDDACGRSPIFLGISVASGPDARLHDTPTGTLTEDRPAGGGNGPRRTAESEAASKAPLPLDVAMPTPLIAPVRPMVRAITSASRAPNEHLLPTAALTARDDGAGRRRRQIRCPPASASRRPRDPTGYAAAAAVAAVRRVAAILVSSAASAVRALFAVRRCCSFIAAAALFLDPLLLARLGAIRRAGACS